MQTVQMALYNFTCVAVKIRNFLFFIVFNLCVDEALNGAATKSTKASEGDVHGDSGTKHYNFLFDSAFTSLTAI